MDLRKSYLIKSVQMSSYVKSYWSDIVDETEEEDADTALDMIIRLWITILDL